MTNFLTSSCSRSKITLGLPTSWTTSWPSNFLWVGQNLTKLNLDLMSDSFTRMTPIYSNTALTKFSDGASQIPSSKVCSISATLRHVEDTLEQRKLPPRCSNLDSTSLLFSKMLTNFVSSVIGASALAGLVDVIWCLCKMSLLSTSSMCGASISWVPSRTGSEMFTFWWPLTMCLSG